MVGEISLIRLKNSISKEELMKKLAEGIRHMREDKAVNWMTQLSMASAPNQLYTLAVKTCAEQTTTQARGELDDVMTEFMNNQFAALTTGSLDLTIPFVLIKHTPQEECEKERVPASPFFNQSKRFCTDYRLLMEVPMLGPDQARRVYGWARKVRFEYYPAECSKPHKGTWVYNYDTDPLATARWAAYWETLIMATRSLRNDNVK